VPLVLYFRVVNFGLSELDDDTIISANLNNTEGSKFNLKEAFTHDALMSDKGDSFYRPMQVISLMIDSEIGGIEPWIYHLSNLILHILTVITLFFFLKKTGIREEISFLLSLAVFSQSYVCEYRIMDSCSWRLAALSLQFAFLYKFHRIF
jgi:hypothetical protein